MWSQKLVSLAVVALLAVGCCWASPLAKQMESKQGYPYSPMSPWSMPYPGMGYGMGAGYPSPMYPGYQGLGAGNYMRPGGMGFMLPYQYSQQTSPGLYSVENNKSKEQ